MNKFRFPSTINVTNATKFDDVDIISKVIVNKIFKYKNISISIFHMYKPVIAEEIEIKAYIVPVKSQKHKYLLFINENSNLFLLKKMLCHEFVHLDQYEKGDLIYDFDQNTHVIYKGQKIYYHLTSYSERPYEIDAFIREKEIYKQLNRLLYN
jgi:hypothetical protein